MNNTIIPVVLITGDNYLIPTAAAINSLIKNKNKDTNYKIFLLYDSLSNENKEIFKKFENECITIEAVRPKDADYLLTIREDGNYTSSAVIFKFAIPEILKDYDKVLYLDADIIVNGDLTELYNTDLAGLYAGVVKDILPIVIREHEKHGLKSYFNAGVMLFNLKQIREDNIDKFLLSEEIIAKTKKYGFFEQDTYNIVFNDKVKYLPPKYNFILESWKRYGLKISSDVFGISAKEGKGLLKEAIIFHLASPQKPWIYKNGLMRKQWVKYFETSPFSYLKYENRKFHDKENRLSKKIIENIFSIKNSENKKNKIITFLGLKIKLKRKSF